MVGHIPVPYSGDINPDGHPDHKGAWPADVYYGEMNAIWTDATVNSVAASRPENINIPGDGKFEQSYIPSDFELQVSRFDFYNMPARGKSEIQMMKNYLNRNHSFRKKEIVLNERGLIDDNFGASSGEAFAISGYKNFAPLVGKSNSTETDFISNLDTTDFLWAYGCGGGSYSSAGGIGNSSQMMNQNVNSIFTMLFGSYFGDWDSSNNFLRSPLCANIPALTCEWAGRPHWALHTMDLGLNIGYGTRATQNNSSLYFSNYGWRYVYVALMGDLTLKQNVLAPPQSVSITNTATGFGKIINWNSSPDIVIGYYVYRFDYELEGYELISGIVNGNSFTDSVGVDGLKHYLVRAMRIETTPSGSYYNLSKGEGGSANVVYQNVSINEMLITDSRFKIYPNPSIDFIFIQCDKKFVHQEYSLMSLEGKILQTGFINSIADKIFFKNIPAGIYFMKISKDESRIVKKVILMK